jgi:hypothetical protein
MRIELAIKMIQVLWDLNIVSLRSRSPYRKTGPGLNLSLALGRCPGRVRGTDSGLRKKIGPRRLFGLKRDCPRRGLSLFPLTTDSLLIIISKAIQHM